MGSKLWNPPPQDEAPSPIGIVPPPPRQHSIGQVRVTCLVAHLDGQGNLLPGCLRCEHCGEFVRPVAMSKKCPGKQPVEPGNEWAGGEGVPVG